MTVEYRVKPVTRFIVTRYENTTLNERGFSFGGCSGRGEFDNYDTAYAVAYALCKHEHDQSGKPAGDMSFIYPGLPRDHDPAAA